MHRKKRSGPGRPPGKKFPEATAVRLERGICGAIDRLLAAEEVRADFIRQAVAREIKRRQHVN